VQTTRESPSSEIPLGEPPIELLSPFERRTFVAMHELYKRARPVTEKFLRTVGVGWINLGSKRMVVVRGLERIRHLKFSDGILLVSNHRSFFDLYMLIVAMHNYTELSQPLLCPVRGDFFYQRPAGIAVNLLVAGGRMFPPFFREPEKAEFNKWGLRFVVEELKRGQIIVGFHPEGTRNKGPDPYTPLPAQPGVGKLVMETWPIIVPAFIQGMSSDILADIKSNYTGDRKAIAVFGEPIDLTPFKKMSNRLASHKRIADALVERIFDLSKEERALRAEMGL
jgi:1-acyl-sn-glycerol-3-phosphate acyltransferase